MAEDHDDKEKQKSNDKLDLCRLCLGSTNVTVHIGQHTDKSVSIIEKIHYCTSLVVKVDDNYYQNICTTCAKNLDFIYEFKSNAIACDLKLSKKVHKDVNFTYTQVSDDPLNMTYKLNLEEQDNTYDIGDSCVFNIVDGDEIIIEQVQYNVQNAICSNKSNSTSPVGKNENIIITKLINDDNQKSKTNELKENLNDHQNHKINIENKNSTFNFKHSLEKSSLNNEKHKQKKIKIDNDIDNDKPSLIVKNGKVVYICGVCSFEADSMAFLLSHRTLVHSDVGSFKCSECSVYYRTPGLLKRHISIHHLTQNCKHCDKMFSNKLNLERHINNHHKITPLEFQCVKCNAYFDTMDKMEDHLVVHYTNPSSTFNCNSCDRSFTTFAARNKHIDLEHTVEIECSICHVVLPSKEAMDKHNNSVHQPKKIGNKMYECNTCKQYFSCVKDILIHRESHLSNQDKH